MAKQLGMTPVAVMGSKKLAPAPIFENNNQVLSAEINTGRLLIVKYEKKVFHILAIKAKVSLDH